MRSAKTIALLALLAAGPATAVTCAQDTVAAATLLVPYFRVSRNGADGGDPIPAEGANTLLAIANTAPIGVIAHLTVFNKYGGSVLGLNVPLQAHDVVFFDMRQILNGDLNLNPSLQRPSRPDVCSSDRAGFGPTLYRRFENPDREDRVRAISAYGALSRVQLSLLRDSLDESGDVTSLLTARAPNLLDDDSPACGSEWDGRLSGDFSGYLTVDVVNYCTNHGPSDPGSLYFVNDAIATNGWAWSVNGDAGESPNVLLGDVFQVDPSSAGGNVSGDPMVALEFDARLATPTCSWANDGGKQIGGCRTFYSRYFSYPSASVDPGGTATGVPAAYRGIGDGREALGSRYGFRYLSDADHGLQSWATVWRTDLWSAASIAPARAPTLCEWLRDCRGNDHTLCRGWGSGSGDRFVTLRIFDNDASLYTASQQGCPPPCSPLPDPYVFLETQRLSLAGNADIGLNDPRFKGGWIDMAFGGGAATGQAWIGVQHSAPGQLVSVGHEATVLSKQIECAPALFAAPLMAP